MQTDKPFVWLTQPIYESHTGLMYSLDIILSKYTIETIIYTYASKLNCTWAGLIIISEVSNCYLTDN